MEKFYLDREDSLLLIIDIQERLLPAMKYSDEVVRATNILTKAAKILNIPIVITEQYPKGLGSTVDKIEDIEDAKVFDKTMFTACIEGVMKEIKSLGKKKIIVVGMETHVCVFQTCRDLINDGYEVFLPIEGVSSRTEYNNDNGIFLIKDMGGVITNVETVLFDLLKDSKAEGFKEISALIK